VGSRVCLYCDSRDGDLLIDEVPGREGLVVASGGSGHAFKFTPMLGGIIADAVEGRPSRWLERFRWRAVDAVTGEEARLRADEHPRRGDSR
jgi:glycine/D-amino acid oxidase-like deaminating enzyme